MRMLPACCAALVLALAGCADDDELGGITFAAPETAVTYETTLDGMPNEALTELGMQSLAAFRRQDDGAQSLAFLKRRAEGDIATLQKILRSEGYYAGEVTVSVEDLPPAEDADPEAAARAQVTFTVKPGPPFTLVRHDFRLQDTSGLADLPPASELGSPVGSPAAAAGIVGAEAAAVKTLERTGYPYAVRGTRKAVADLEAATLEVDTPIRTGPQAVFGALVFDGLEDVRERYLRTYLPWEAGDVFDLTKLRDYQQALLGTDLFAALTVRPPETPPEGRAPVPVPVTVTAEERPVRTVSAGGRYSTDDGPSVTAGFEHRNLFGENETVTIEALAGLEIQRLGIGYREPQYMRPGQDLLASLVLRREEDDSFDDLTATATLGLQRRLSPEWLVGAGLLGEASLIEDNGVETTAFLGGLPLFAAYDTTDDTLNPTEGVRWRTEVTPYAGLFDDEFAGFLTLDTVGSTYLDLTGEDDFILAVRGRVASILAEDVDKVPQTRRLYAGGGGSVRGYAQRFIGPLDALNDPEGGLSALEAGAEFRARLIGDIGGVVFVEAGAVDEESFPAFGDGVQVAAGLGVRYYSPAGPIRVDVAFPLNGRDADDAFQLYFSIGQAF